MDERLRGWLLVRRAWGQDVEILDEDKNPIFQVEVFVPKPGQALGCAVAAGVATVLALGSALHGRVGPGAVILGCLGGFLLVGLGLFLPAVLRRPRLRFVRDKGTGPVLAIEEVPTRFELTHTPPPRRYRLLDASGDTLAWMDAHKATDGYGRGEVLASLGRSIEPPLPGTFVKRHGLADDRLHQGYLELYDHAGVVIGSLRRHSPLLDAALIHIGDGYSGQPSIPLALAILHEVISKTMEDYELDRARGLPTFVDSGPGGK